MVSIMGLVYLEDSIFSLYTNVETILPPLEPRLSSRLQEVLSLVKKRSSMLVLSSPHLQCPLFRVVPYDTPDAHEDTAACQFFI